MYFITHRFIFRPQMLGLKFEPRTFETFAMAVGCSNTSARSHKGMLNYLELLCRLPRKQEHLCVE